MMENTDNFLETLEGSFLRYLCEEQIEISIYLVNGIRLKGVISKFNRSVILLKNGTVQMIRQEAVSTIMPTLHHDDIKSGVLRSKF